MPLQPDTLIHDRYRILAELGHGGMGAVYKCRDENLGVDVAIKENLFTSPEAERQFRREATLLASVRHPHLPRVTDHFVIEGQGQYLVMDFIPGEDAKQIMERQQSPLPENDVARWGREILNALSYLHGRPHPIVHRDIKPGNIKITPDGRAVLVDFGLAKVHDTSQTTTVGAKALTPGYAPPEQYGMGRTDPRTDIYALGATLYMLLTNQVPADSIDRAMGQKTLTPIRESNASVSAQTAAAVERALAIKPEDRFLTAAEFADALPVGGSAATLTPPAPATVVRAAETVVKHPVPAQPLPATRPVARPGWLVPAIVIGVVVLLGLGGGASLIMAGVFGERPSPTPPPTLTPPPTDTAVAVVVAATDTPMPTAAPSDTPTSAPVLPTHTPTVAISPSPQSTPRGGGHGQLAFASERTGGRPQIFLMDLDGSNVRQLTSLNDGACQPAWSPDGQRVLFVSPCAGKRDSYPGSALYIMNADGTNPQPLGATIQLVGGAYDADWSAISGIAVTGLENNQPRVYVAKDSDTRAVRISESLSTDSHPSWSPDGERLVFFNRSRAGTPTLYWMFKDGTFSGTRPDQVTQNQVVAAPAWSPGGDLIAYVVNSQIMVIRWDAHGFNFLPLTTRGPNADPRWSPDGNWITFESWRDAANHDIYTMTAGGGQQTRLTDDPAQDYQPAWRP